MLLAVVLPTYGSEALTQVFGGDEGRWHYAMAGLSAALMFCVVAILRKHWAVAGVCALGFFEFGLKGICGLARLYEPVFAPDGYVCGDAGPGLSLAGLFSSALIAWVLYAKSARSV